MARMYKCKAFGKREYYIIAHTPKKAKILYREAIKCRMSDVGCCVVNIDVDRDEYEGIVYPGSELALSYGVEYDRQQRV